MLGSVRAEMLEWLNATPAHKGDNQLGFDQGRTGDLSFNHRLWVEFDDRNHAMLFKTTWGC